jgi:hypothetical protein
MDVIEIRQQFWINASDATSALSASLQDEPLTPVEIPV